MKILLTGGGTAGHFYPLVAVAEEIRKVSKELKLLEPKLYYMAPVPYDEKALFDNKIIFKRNSAGKRRVYFSLLNFLDLFKTAWGMMTALWQMFIVYPDVIFAKGGYVSFPVLFAGRFFKIPIIIHESDSVPGRVNKWAGKFARAIAISFAEAGDYFPEGKIAHTGLPIRKEVLNPSRRGAQEFLRLEENVPVILILGGSQGAKIINENILAVLPRLVEKYQIIHQTGEKNYKHVSQTAKVILKNSKFSSRYRAFGYLNALALRMSAGGADLIVSRAGSGIFEIAAWAVPSIVIPITNSNGDHQRKNAFSYSRSGAAIVIEERNLTPNVLISEMNRLMADKELLSKMAKAAEGFSKKDAAEKIAKEIIDIGLEHAK